MKRQFESHNRHRLEATSDATFSKVACLIANIPSGAVRLRAAYSVKTNPRALSNRFEPEAIVYNGPRPLSDRRLAVHVAFGDSIVTFGCIRESTGRNDDRRALASRRYCLAFRPAGRGLQ